MPIADRGRYIVGIGLCLVVFGSTLLFGFDGFEFVNQLFEVVVLVGIVGAFVFWLRTT